MIPTATVENDCYNSEPWFSHGASKNDTTITKTDTIISKYYLKSFIGINYSQISST